MLRPGKAWTVQPEPESPPPAAEPVVKAPQNQNQPWRAEKSEGANLGPNLGQSPEGDSGK